MNTQIYYGLGIVWNNGKRYLLFVGKRFNNYYFCKDDNSYKNKGERSGIPDGYRVVFRDKFGSGFPILKRIK